jgi:hypothetical protein
MTPIGDRLNCLEDRDAEGSPPQQLAITAVAQSPAQAHPGT